MHPIERLRWNLTSTEQFRRDYERLAARVDDVVGAETAVFVGTVPHVTIPPITTGIPPFRETREYIRRIYSFLGLSTETASASGK